MTAIIYTLAAVGASTIALATLLFVAKNKPVQNLREQHLERWGNKP